MHFIYTYEVDSERYTSMNNYNLKTFLYSRISHANHLNIFETYFGFIIETVRRICKICIYTYVFVYRVGRELCSHNYFLQWLLSCLETCKQKYWISTHCFWKSVKEGGEQGMETWIKIFTSVSAVAQGLHLLQFVTCQPFNLQMLTY